VNHPPAIEIETLQSNQRPKDNSHPRVALMILNFNGLRWLKVCLPSVVKSTYPRLALLVIDNGSTDGSIEFVRANYPSVSIIRFEENLGFAEAYNRAIGRIKAKYVLLLNNDTEVLDREWIDIMVGRAEKDRAMACVGCKLVSMQDHQKLDSLGGVGIRYWRGFRDIGKNESDNRQYDAPPVVPFSACAAAVLIRRSAFVEVGGFDSKLFTYFEDVDLSWRLRLLGYKIMCELSVRVAHHLSGTSGIGKNGLSRFVAHKNVMRIIIKNTGSSIGWALRNYLLFATIETMVSCVRIAPRKAAAAVRGILWNVLNFRDTYGSRLLIQRTRRTSEAEILASMYPKLPIDRSLIRAMPLPQRLFNNLFERLNGPCKNT